MTNKSSIKDIFFVQKFRWDSPGISPGLLRLRIAMTGYHFFKITIFILRQRQIISTLPD